MTRNLIDRHILAIAERRGVIGIGYWESAVCEASVEGIIRAMKYIKNLVGNTENIALGSDFDETVEVPFNAAGLSQLTEGLLDSGFSDSEIREIMGGMRYACSLKCYHQETSWNNGNS